MRDAWEERAAVVGAFWTFAAVPVVVVDAVAVPDGWGYVRVLYMEEGREGGICVLGWVGR